jgi:hypothetical protein
VKRVYHMTEDQALDYLAAKSLELRIIDKERGRETVLNQFLIRRFFVQGSNPNKRSP